MIEKIKDILEKHYYGRNAIEDRCSKELLDLFTVSQRSEQLVCTFELGVENCGFEKKDVDNCKNFRKCEFCAN